MPVSHASIFSIQCRDIYRAHECNILFIGDHRPDLKTLQLWSERQTYWHNQFVRWTSLVWILPSPESFPLLFCLFVHLSLSLSWADTSLPYLSTFTIAFIFKVWFQGTDSFKLPKSKSEILIWIFKAWKLNLLRSRSGILAPSPAYPGPQWFLYLTFLSLSPLTSTALVTCFSVSLCPLFLPLPLLLGFCF